METYLKQEDLKGMQVYKTYTKIENLNLDPQNPRDISDEKLQDLQDFLSKYPSLKPLLVDIRPEKEGQLIGGNQRLKAYKKLGVTEVWIEPRDPMTDAQAFEMGTVDNMEFGHYIEEMLMERLKQYGEELDLSKLGVNMGEIPTFEQMLRNLQEDVVEDEAPPIDETKTTSQVGEVYQLGRHRLMCGDATKIEDVEKLMDGQKADMVLTDPPYNTGMQQKDESTASTRLGHMFNDSYTPEQFDELLNGAFSNMVMVTKGDAAFYICIDWRKVGLLKDKIQKLMSVKNIIVWDKVVHGLGSDYQFTYELIIVGKKGNPEINNRIGDDYKDIWHIQREMGRNEDHATAKPITLLAKPITHASKQDDIVLDLFGGSGSTLIASEQLNRSCYTMELDPKYCDVIRKRYAKFLNREEEWETLTPKINDVQETNSPVQGVEVQPQPEQSQA